MVSAKAEALGDAWRCRVVVDHRGELTEHLVTVTQGDLERWGRGTGIKDVEDLVRRSFDFLLEREPPSSILRSFDLSVIERYFPEYDLDIRK